MNNAIAGLGSKLASALNDVQKSIVSTHDELSNGTQTLKKSELGVVTRLSAQSTSYGVVVKNISSAQNVVSVAQTSLTSIASVMSEMKSLATQAASAGISDGDRANLNNTFALLAKQVANLGINASVNGNNLLDPTTTPTLKVATNIPGSDISATQITSIDVPAIAKNIGASLNEGGPAISISSIDAAAAALETINAQLVTVATGQAVLAAAMTGLDAQQNSAQSLSDGLTSLAGAMQKIDSTKLQAQLQALNTQQSVDYYLVTQLNAAAGAVLNIFR